MKTAYFDCSSGISGNMIIGALIDAGLPAYHLKKEIKKLRIAHYALRITKIKKSGLTSTYFNVLDKGQKKNRSLKDIISIINRSSLNYKIKTKVKEIFKTLAAAESKVHGVSIDRIHFHELGAIDTIIDIVGALLGLDYLGIDEIYCSPINTGTGFVKAEHGVMPIPPPATLELLKGIPIYHNGIKKELITPTGAVIIKSLAKGFGPIPRIKAEQIGYGAGGYNLTEQPNVLRIIIGKKEIQAGKDAILQIETNIDDMNPKYYDKAIASIMKAGALDAYIIPIRMKKQRNAIQLIAICNLEDKDKILGAIFSETTSFGVRIYLVQREKLKKEIVRTKYGRIKVGKLGNKIKTMAIEPDDYIRLKNKVPMSRIFTVPPVSHY